MSKAITERTDEPGPSRWQPGVEIAPSVLREDEPTVARTFGLAGAACVIFGGASLMFHAFGWSYRVPVGWGTFILVVGIVGMLAHAAFDPDLQVRRLYWGLGLGLLGLGALLCLVPVRGVGSMFGLGYPCLGLALLFLLGTQRHETDLVLRRATLTGIGAAGLVMVGAAVLLGNNFWGEFLIPYGLLLALMGLAYLASFAARHGSSTELGYRAALAIGAVGALALVIGLLRSSVPPLVHSLGWLRDKPPSFLVPWGLMYMGVGVLFVGVALGLASDNRVVVMTRRELATFFYSPIAYFVLIALTVVGMFMFWGFVKTIADTRPNAPPLFEPIVQYYILRWPPVICVIFIVPVLTMRLLSEEKRTGTLEVLLTAPVDEASVVLSKFLACLIMFLLLWVPWGLFLVALRIIGGQPFDYQALISFFIALTCTGAGFIGMGLFFSSLTRNQIASAVLTFAGMLGLTFVIFVERDTDPKSAWNTVLNHVTYVDLWIKSLEGLLVPRHLLFHLSAAVLWVFLTIKVLEARKWS